MRRADAFFSRIDETITIGVTGGIGSGKSTVTKILAELGAPVIDADKVGHAIYQPDGPAYADMIAAFGEGIMAPDRTIDRKKLGPIVFADPAALKRLNSIVHPKMFARMREMIDGMRAEGERKPIVVEAAILIEANWQPLFDEIWLVTTSKEKVIDRVERERGLQREQTEARIKAQLSDEERLQYASEVIANDGTLDELRSRVTTLWQTALSMSPS
ncbi:MAG TPA: dephospho-CoA kinase [Candidatus Binataceae bacterium]|nr:dephospho-CoA kinase [Candidatus Binataceae bacterium]